MIEIFPIYMNLFKQERLIRVYLPKNYYGERKPYPVLYMHDGKNIFRDCDAVGGISLNLVSYLKQNELDVIVVGIDQNSEERINEYCPWMNGEYSKKILNILGQSIQTGGKGREYVNFIVNELKPYIDQKYRTIKDCTAMAGISLGGLITTYAACRYPDIFKHIIIFSSAFYRNQEEMEKLIQQSDLSDIESFYMDCGTNEWKNQQVNEEYLTSNQSIYNMIKKKITNATFEIIEGGEHNYDHFKRRIPKLFQFLLTLNK